MNFGTWDFLAKAYTYDQPRIKNAKLLFLATRYSHKISFLWFSRKISILAYMLIHKSNINVAIANILLYWKSLYDLQKPRYNFCIFAIHAKSGRGHSSLRKLVPVVKFLPKPKSSFLVPIIIIWGQNSVKHIVEQDFYLVQEY